MSLYNILNSPSIAGMRALRQWCIYQIIPNQKRPGKNDKIPLHYATMMPTGVNNPNSWTDCATAVALATQLGPSFGVGFCFTKECGYWFVDLDSAFDGQSWTPFAQHVFHQLNGAAVEISSSLRGGHAFGRGVIPPHRNKNEEHHAEFYHTDRFVAMTGIGLAGNCDTDHTIALAALAAGFFPPRVAAVDAGDVPDDGPRSDWCGPADDDELLRRAMGSRSLASVYGAKACFADLWNADEAVLVKCYPGSEPGTYDASSADAALAQHLAFWTGCDVARMERLMRRSALLRDKWDARDDYLVPRTITGACGQCREVYSDPRALPVVQPAVEVASELHEAAGPGSTVPMPIVAADHAMILSGIKPPAIRGMLACGTDGKPTLPKITEAIIEAGLWVGLDEFTGLKMVRVLGQEVGQERELRDVDYIRMRMHFEYCDFKSVKAETVRDAVESAADLNRYNSAQRRVQGLVWDGVKRIDTFCARYWGAADNAYTRAIGAYMWTAHAGRVLSPGCKADMAVILVGEQGARKSTTIAALALDPSHFGEVDLEKDEDDIARIMRGKTTLEMPELRGLSKKDMRATKNFVSRAVDEWVPKFKEGAQKVPRTSLLYGSTNELQFLNDATGERRWLPLITGKIDIEATRRDVEQLWAEGAVRYLAGGVEWEAAETLARDEHDKFKITDEFDEKVQEYVERNPGAPLRLEDLFLGGFGRAMAFVPRAEQLQAGNMLRRLGYRKSNVLVNGRQGKYWCPPLPPLPPEVMGGRPPGVASMP